MAEEVGLQAEKWYGLGSFFTDPGISNQVCNAYLAYELKKIEMRNPDQSEEIKEILTLKVDEIEKLLNSGSVEGWTIAAWYLYNQQKNNIKIK